MFLFTQSIYHKYFVCLCFFVDGLELLVFILIDKNLIELDVQKIRQRFPLELMRLFTPDYSPVVYRIKEEL